MSLRTLAQVVEHMFFHSSGCMSGDSTLSATIRAVREASRVCNASSQSRASRLARLVVMALRICLQWRAQPPHEACIPLRWNVQVAWSKPPSLWTAVFFVRCVRN